MRRRGLSVRACLCHGSNPSEATPLRGGRGVGCGSANGMMPRARSDEAAREGEAAGVFALGIVPVPPQ